ncbi:MAG: ATP synthase F1 subunit delta, partial [Bacillota bacterium]|nr:ATP synthase F1 subunit delta [Bacillota bacterium]
MAELTVDMTYGTALFEAAKDLKLEERIKSDAKLVSEAIESDSEFQAFLRYPGIAGDDKKKVIEEVFAGVVCEEFLNFLCVLIDKRRIDRLRQIVKAYEELVEKEDGVSYGVVYSVIKLSEDRLAELEEETSKLLQTKVKLENEIDPKLIAGVKILVEGKLIDASYKKR